MSNFQKQQRPGATPIKNPLLSASVTGLTFDDFPNKPLLLPAAPPIAHTPASAPSLIASGLGSREPKSLVTVGSSSLDTENLDEINLNISNDDNQTSDTTDPNANPLLEKSNTGTNADSILSQAASSFSALPSVASSVLSTFSKRFTAISSRETTPVSDHNQQDYNSNSVAQQFQQEDACAQTFPTFYGPPLPGNGSLSNFDASCQAKQKNLPAAEPPKFYTPAEVPPIPSINTAPAPSGQNSFRFSSKKKLYAPIPGLSGQSQIPAATFDSASVNVPIPYVTSNHYPSQTAYLTPPTSNPEVGKIANPTPTTVLQSTAGSLTQPDNADFGIETRSNPSSDQLSNNLTPLPPTTNYFIPQDQANKKTQKQDPQSICLLSKVGNLAPSGTSSLSGSVQQNNYFSAAPPATNYFIPQEQPNTETPKQVEQSIALFSEVGNRAPSGTSSLPVFDQRNNSFSAPPPTTNYFIPQNQTTVAEPFPTPNTQSKFTFSGEETETGLHINPQPVNEGLRENISQIPLYNPSIIQSQFIPGKNLESSLETSPAQRPPSNLGSSQQAATEQIAFFDPTQYLPASNHTPYSAYKAPPPSSGQTSYRLQKGTKLYKSPLTPQETALDPVTPRQIPQNLVLPYSVHPPVGVPLSTVTQTSLSATYPSSPSFGIEALTTSHKQNVSLFTPFIEDSKSVESSQSIPKISSDQASLPLFASPPASIKSSQGVSLYASTVEEQKSHDIPQTILSAPSQAIAPLSVPPSAIVLNPAVPFPAVDTVEVSKSSESFPSDPIPAPSNNLVQDILGKNTQEKNQKFEEQTSVSFAPPIKRLKSDELVLAKVEENKIVRELETEGEQSQQQKLIVERQDPLEIFEQHFLAQVSKPDPKQNIVDNTDTQSIFEPIEPVFEPNITALQEGIIVDPLEETLQKLSITSKETIAVKLPPIGESFNLKNPYRKGSKPETAKTSSTLPTLANFFTSEPSAAGTANLNFFTSLPPSQSNSSEVNFFSESGQLKEDSKDNAEPAKSQAAGPINFFTKPFSSELAPIEPQTSVHPPISAFFPTNSVPAIVENTNTINSDSKGPFDQENLPPPKGFENIKQLEPIAVVPSDNKTELPFCTTIQQETSTQTQQPEVVNRFSIFFNQTNQQPQITKDPSTFFDSISASQQQLQPQQEQQLDGTVATNIATNEEQRIQYFFNNPPPKDASDVGDLNYDLVHSGLGIKNLQHRSLTPISNLVEPPSSACSEFSEISTSAAGQKSISVNLSITEISEIQESNKSVAEHPSSDTLESNVKLLEDLPEEILKELGMANSLSADKTTTSPVATVSYKPAVKHWFFKRTVNDKQIWIPFSHYDSALLETSLLMEGDENSNIVAVEGSRYDVNISERKKMSVYWESPPIEVRRCSWFYKAVDSKYVPYEEETAEVLENEYKQAAESGVWRKTIILGMGEQVVFHGPTVIVHFQQQQNTDAWGGTTQTATRPRVVKRDLDDFNIEQGESQKVDHLLFMVHGIGSACDLKLRSVEEVVEDFRTIARQLVQSHYKNSTDLGLVGRVEVLPISWHSHLHSAEMGIDEKLRMITLESIPKLRNFTNDTLLDILFYTSPTYCQKIMNTIVSSMNTLYLKYRARHPEFNGGVSLAGHSLGSLILFDLLCHQNPIKESEEKNLENPDQFLAQIDSNQLEDKQMSYTMGPAGTGQPFIHYNQLIFQPKKFFALGSPIGMFVTIRGIDKLGLDFRLPTCPGFYNIFHPYDPVAYRIEALVNPDLSGIRPVLIPHHKGRKRMHLELKETMARVSMDLKNRFLDKFKTTLDSVNIFGSSSKSTKEAEEMMEKEVDKVIQMQMQLEQDNRNDNLPSGSECQSEPTIKSRQRTDSVSTVMSDDAIEIDFPLGKLNDSKRIDYVLQEAPLEFINEYIFALSSHVCYWDSEDTILFVMKEIYSGLGISPDSQVPQQTMTIERPSSRNSLIS